MATAAHSSAVRRGKSKYVETPGRKRRYQGRYSHAIHPPSKPPSLELAEDEPPPAPPQVIHVQARARARASTLEAKREDGGGEDEVTRNPRLERWLLLVEKRRVRQFFRLCAVVNVLSLTCSGPFMRCEGGYSCTAQFVIIACVDFVLSVLFTVQLVARLQYAWWQHTTAKKVMKFATVRCVSEYVCTSVLLAVYVGQKRISMHLLQAPAPPTFAAIHGGQPGQRYKEQTSTTCTRLLLLGLVTFSLWWSVAIGVSA